MTRDYSYYYFGLDGYQPEFVVIFSTVPFRCVSEFVRTWMCRIEGETVERFFARNLQGVIANMIPSNLKELVYRTKDRFEVLDLRELKESKKMF